MESPPHDQLLKRIRDEGFVVSYNPPGDGRCFYAATAFQLGLKTETVHSMVFEYLRSHRITVLLFYLIIFRYYTFKYF